MKVAIYIRQSGTRNYILASPRAPYSPDTIFCLRFTEDGKRTWQQFDVQSYRAAPGGVAQEAVGTDYGFLQGDARCGHRDSRNLDLPAPRRPRSLSSPLVS